MLNDDMNNHQLFATRALKKNDHAVRRMRAAFSLAMSTLLSACAFAPGQHMADHEVEARAAAGQLGAGDHAATAVASCSARRIGRN